MPYREKRIYAGEILEVELYPVSIKERKMKRSKKLKESLNKQKNLNDKNAKKHLIRLLNTNFTKRDLHVTLTYDNKNLPKSEEEAKKDVTNFLRRVKHYRTKNKLDTLKYIAVVEYKEPKDKEKSIRMHHHLVISDMDRDIVEELWKKGRANADRLKPDEFGLEGLARYLSKDPKGNKRWTQSRNLKQPTIKINDYKYSGKKIYEMARSQGAKEIFQKNYPGYIFTHIKQEVNSITGHIHMSVKMRKMNGRD